MEPPKFEINVAGELTPNYAIDIIDNVSLGKVDTIYNTYDGSASYNLNASEASTYVDKFFSEDPELTKEEKQKNTGIYYLERDGRVQSTPLPSPGVFRGESITLEGLALTQGDHFCYSIHTELDEGDLYMHNEFTFEDTYDESRDRVEKVQAFFGMVESRLFEEK